MDGKMGNFTQHGPGYAILVLSGEDVSTLYQSMLEGDAPFRLRAESTLSELVSGRLVPRLRFGPPVAPDRGEI